MPRSASAPVAAAVSPLRLHLAGTPLLLLGGRELHVGTRKALTLALLMALEPGLRRVRAADLLWPEADPAAARRNLRRDLFRLRQRGLAVADGSGDTLTLPALELVWPPPTAYAPRWLDGLDEVAGAELAHWVDLQRALLQRRWIDTLAAQARQLEQSGAAQAALQAWRALLADGAAGPGHGEARAALQRLLPEAADSAADGRPANGAGLAPAAVPGGRRRGPIRFVGRVAERAAIEQALALGQTVLLDGSPGVGKTRLALEALASRGGVLVLRCRPEDTAVPYASALRGLHALREAAPDVELPAWMRRDLALLVPEWAGRGGAEPGPAAAERLQRAYQAALQTLAEGNFGSLLIDDWQWADEASQALWEPGAAGWASNALPCVIVHRSAELPLPALQRRRRWLDQGQAHVLALHLPPLPAAEVHNLLDELGAQALDPAGQALLIDRGGGNPLLLIETLRHLLQHGGSSLPASVLELIVARVRALGPVVRRVLEVACLADDDLQVPLLALAAGIDELAVAQALEHAAVAELLQVDARGRHRFAHDLIVQAISDSLSPVRRRTLHGQLAVGLGASGAEPGRVARHLDQAERHADAAPWHLRAAQVAVQRLAFADALAGCAAVLTAATEPGLRLDARLCMARVLRRQSDPVQAEAVLQAATADAVAAGPERVIDLALAQADLLSNSGHAEQALARLQALSSDPALQPAQRRLLLQQHASSLAYQGQHGASLLLLRELLASLPASALAERRKVLGVLARGTYWVGDLVQARSLVEQELALSRCLGDEASAASGLYRLGVLDREQGLLDRALPQLLEAAATARRIGHVEILRSALSTTATLMLNQMRLAEAEALIVEGEQAAPYWDSPGLEDVYDERRYRLHHLRGEVDLAWRVTQRSIQRYQGGQGQGQGHTHLNFHVGSLTQAVNLALLTGDTTCARCHLDQALALQQASGEPLGEALAVRLVQVLRAEGRGAEAVQQAADWLAGTQAHGVEEHARLLATAAEAALDTAAEAALDITQLARAAAWLAKAESLPGVPMPVQALLLAAGVRCARASGGSEQPALHAAHAWLAQPVLPVLEAHLLRSACRGQPI